VRRGLIPLVLFSLGATVALLLGEVVVRLFGVAPEIGWIERGRFRLSDNPKIVYEPVPALDYRGEDLDFFDYRGKSNRLGYRDVDHSIQKEPGVYRVVVLGDSVAAGLGVERNEDTFPWRMAARLRESGRAVEVLNFGVSGYNSGQEVATLESRALEFGPDLVVLAYCLNDGEAPYRGIVEALTKVREETRLIDRAAAPPLLGRSALYRFLLFRRPRFLEPAAGAAWTAVRPDSVERALARLELLAERHRFAVLLVVFPRLERLFRYRWQEHHDWLAAQAEQRGFYYLDLLPAFRECWSKGGQKIARDVWHPTAGGHRCAADAIVRFILEKIST
jgi:lysophospholipase L1-like esterase